ncbi:unnamed protein product [Didymodactylos carnosus]|uniref:Uncharacterized protein n=1 Tax=Didymodactylos carnosus TaxID=1234261 RepID=A0A814RH15_9BILA|nr:unnamed protein product [Didymodactylos carnosus]CAF3896926.1 unnamed protein product [Didymodactylos carnosus]
MVKRSRSSLSSDTTPYKRRKETNIALETLGQYLTNDKTNATNNTGKNNTKYNKNDTLSLTLARLIKAKYLDGNVYDRNSNLSDGINCDSHDNNGFIIILTNTGRVVVISDDVEHHLRKSVRSLYPQMTNIYDCVDKNDKIQIQNMLSNQSLENEQQVLCTWHLPRGKRPSRTQMETKTILMTGHYHQFSECTEPLFIARCQSILASTPNMPNSAHIFKLTVNDGLIVKEVSESIETTLQYSVSDLIETSLNRIVVTDDIRILEKARKNCVHRRHCSTMCVIDLYSKTGHRLTFLCNMHMLLEGRRKAMKYGLILQLIDSSLRSIFEDYVEKQNISSSSRVILMPKRTSSRDQLPSTQDLSVMTNAVCPVIESNFYDNKESIVLLKSEPMTTCIDLTDSNNSSDISNIELVMNIKSDCLIPPYSSYTCSSEYYQSTYDPTNFKLDGSLTGDFLRLTSEEIYDTFQKIDNQYDFNHIGILLQ